MQQFCKTAGEIRRGSWKQSTESLPFFLGNGRFGGCFDAWGLQTPGHLTGTAAIMMHGDHYSSACHLGYGAFLPVGNVTWSQTKGMTPDEYSQCFTPADGRLTTCWKNAEWGYQLHTSFNPDFPNVLCLELQWENAKGKMPALGWHFPELHGVISPELRFDSANCHGQLKVQVLDGPAPSATVTSDGVSYDFPAEKGHCRFFLQFGAVYEDFPSEEMNWQQATADAWSCSLGTLPPTGSHSSLWSERLIRYAYHLLASYGPDVRCPMPPCGLSGVSWKNPFPMDLSFVHPALISMGRADIPEAWSRFFASRIPQMEEYTRRVFNRPGCMWAWEFPPGSESPHHLKDGEQVNQTFYELHNAVYPAKIAYDTAKTLKDDDFTRNIAWPLLQVSTRFLVSCLKQENDGTYGIYHETFSGQDEAAGPGGGNYLCALFATDWLLTHSLELADQLLIRSDEIEAWRRIHDCGLNFQSLLDRQLGIYSVCNRFTASERMGLQKHPVQLNRLWSLPAPLTEADKRAWELHEQLCTENGSCGWTRLVFLQAAANLGDADAFDEELQAIQDMGLVDAEGLQLDEAPPEFMKRMEWQRTPYYITNEAMLLQSFFIISSQKGE